MPERRRPHRRSRRSYKRPPNADPNSEPNPYRDGETDETAENTTTAEAVSDAIGETGGDGGGGEVVAEAPPPAEIQPGNVAPAGPQGGSPPNHHQRQDFPRNDGDYQQRNGRRNRRHRGRRGRDNQQTPQVPVVADGETTGWFDTNREGGFVRRANNSYLNENGDAWVPPHLMRQAGLRRGDTVTCSTGRDHRGRVVCVDVLTINGVEVANFARRPDFSALTATYPDRRITLETGRPAKAGPELTRRAIDLMSPIGFGQRALIVAPARAGKTMLLHAITEGIALNHPEAVLLILLVDERPEEVSEAISWGVGEVVSSSFDQPAQRHVEVCEIVLEHARRQVEMGKDVVIVLDSLTRMARAHNTAERGSGRTMSGGLDTTAMAKPKAFFGSARCVAPKDGGGSLTIIATALVETGSRMDDVIFEEFKGTGNCEIKLDRSLSEKRIFPAFDIAASGTRREEKLYKTDQLDAIYTLRRGLQQMPPQAAMEWMIKRIAATPNNDAFLSGL
ncbi:MAG: transcription termination factor Rho [Gemmatimonadaceae bacterium]|nr:transcription termination factor Rho [Gemmatimonadaceae bacterium]